jgi:catechol 2,3-dioxygenase-like lactoylglutathione lyase family enzyme
MRVTRITANLPVDDIDAARSFYADFLGLTVGFDLGWVVNFHASDNEAIGVQLVTRLAGCRTSPPHGLRDNPRCASDLGWS